MKTSCGIIIINEENEIFMGHSTGNKFFDIPKGMLEENELPITCALRECDEETSLKFKEEELKDLGEFKYNREKNLHLFLVFVKKEDIKIEELVCNSFFEHLYTKKMVPEADYFQWISLNLLTENCAKSMGKLLNKLNSDGIFKLKKNEYKIN